MRVNTAAVRGVARLAFDAVTNVTDIVEGMHLNISSAPLPLAKPALGRTRGITGLVYAAIRNIAGAVGEGVDRLLSLAPAREEPFSASAKQEAFLAALNGVVGDHLEASANPLALPMRFRSDGIALQLNREALAAAFPEARPKLLIMLHGLCMNDRQWQRKGHNHGALLAEELGYTPLYLHYNSGRHISYNGAEFASLMQQLHDAWPVKAAEITFLAHSLGGLVARSACHYAARMQHAWLKSLHRIVFLGTPHHGAPLERGGNQFQALAGITPYSAPLSRLGMLRSAGVTDLRHGNLLDEDWREHNRFAIHTDTRQLVPLPADVECFAVAATTASRRGDLKDRLLGDGLVPVESALGRHRQIDRSVAFATEKQSVHLRLNHWDLLSDAGVYRQLRDWLAGPPRAK